MKLGFLNEAVYHIQCIEKNRMIICSTSGVTLVELKNNTLSRLSNLYRGPSFNVLEAKNNNYFAATFNGLLHFQLNGEKLVESGFYNSNTSPALSYDNARVLLYEVEKNILWIGTEGGGLNLAYLDDNCSPKIIHVFKKEDNYSTLSNNYVREIKKGTNGVIWIGTYEGLNKLKRDSITGVITFENFTVRDGLPNNMIQLIEEDKNGNLWLGTNAGLVKFHTETNRIKIYNASDGLQNIEFSEHTSCVTLDGEIVVGGINGFLIFCPNEITTNQLLPHTRITSFYVNNEKIKVGQKKNQNLILTKSILFSDSITLLPHQNDFRFDFSSMQFNGADKIEYAYILEGYDNRWNVGKERYANYTNISHGEYIFKVKATNPDGLWEENPTSVLITVKTPVYLTWYALILYFLLGIFGLYYFAHFSIIRNETKRRFLMENEHNLKLHELDRLRTRFFINISHDLRTPLTLIYSPLEKILQSNDLPSGIEYSLKLIQRNVKRLKFLTEQLLDLRKAETGNLIAKTAKIDILDFIKNEIRYFEYAVQNKNLTLEVISEKQNMYVDADPAMLSKIFFNIISNALKYTHVGGIIIQTSPVSRNTDDINLEKQFVQIEIKDTGTGISLESQKHLFERFYQDETGHGTGYGIGLSHCKDMIDAHSGIIEVESESGKGTNVRILLPVKTEAAQNNNIQNIQYDSNSENVLYEYGNEMKVPDSQKKKQSGKKILVVEDNDDMLVYIKSSLEAKYEVWLAKDGIEGLSKAKQMLPDLVISDIMMPHMDGIELCKNLKSNLKTSHIPVILLTARVDAETKYKGLEIGADDYVEKPFDVNFLLARMKNILNSREHLRELFQKNYKLEPSKTKINSLDEQFLAKLMAAIERGIPEADFTVSILEKEMGMSHSNFYRKLKSLTGMTGKDVLLNMRMKRASQLLKDHPEMRISDIAYMVGFTNPKYFSKCFKQLYGIIPSEFIAKEASLKNRSDMAD